MSRRSISTRSTGARSRGRARLFGAAALAGVTALSGCSFNGVESLPLPGGPDLGPHPRTVKIEFANVLDLVPKSAVKVNDVSVGKVEKIELAGEPGGQGQGAAGTPSSRSSSAGTSSSPTTRSRPSARPACSARSSSSSNRRRTRRRSGSSPTTT